ncbi:sulfite exporter TauE/SafE family protein [Pleionea sediminis]|uniref:sulfite exporter TauE/SafE family protein n=1 Tax=Pleionea sediminis TaxID=2569479 RepID=UPI001184B186|nr:sulfite exporter TauE/SafE family protein [Pleionea sediminis]
MYFITSYWSRWLFFVSSLSLLYVICIFLNDTPQLFEHRLGAFGHFFFIGLLAAIIANSTGAGGGIIFLPAFTMLGISTETALSTSFAIQCFGMTSGALAWLSFRQRERNLGHYEWHGFTHLLTLSVVGSLIGLLLAQYVLPPLKFDVHSLFSFFSIFVGLYIVLAPFLFKAVPEERSVSLSYIEQLFLLFVAIIGGMVTAWLSVGVGELVAIALLAMKFRVQQAVAVAVCVSSISVIVGVMKYVGQGIISTDILLFAAPAAMIGGAVARVIATWLGAIKLKTMMGIWITLSGVLYLQFGVSA